MKVSVKALLGGGATVFAAAGWGLYAASGKAPATSLTQEDSPVVSPQSQPATLSSDNEITKLIKDHQRFIWEINSRDGMIDYKNGQIEELNKELEKKDKRNQILQKEFIKEFNENYQLKKRIKELEEENKAWEEYAEDLEDNVPA